MNPLFLQPFLTLLSEEGFSITLDDYRRISIVLRAEATWTTEKLKAILLALLVKNPKQEELFLRRFDSVFKTETKEELFLGQEAVNRLVGKTRGAVQEESSVKLRMGTGEVDRRPPPQRFKIKSISPDQIIAGGGEVTLTISGNNFNPSARVFIGGRELPTVFKNPQEISATVPADISSMPVKRTVVIKTRNGENTSDMAFLEILPKHGEYFGFSASLIIGIALFLVAIVIVYLTRTDEPKTANKNTSGVISVPGIPLPTPSRTPTPTPTPTPSPLDAFFPVRLMALLFLGLVALYCLYLNRLMRKPKDEPKTWNPQAPQHFPLGQIGGGPAPLLSPSMLNQLAESLRYYESQEASDILDIDASVEETGRKGGLPTLIYRRKKNIPTVVIIEDANAEPTAWNSTPRELAAGLRQRGIQVIHGKFFESPLLLHAANQVTYRLDQLEGQKEAFLLLYFSDSKCFHEHNACKLEFLSQWPMIAWMELRERRFWDENTGRVALHNIPVYPATPDSLLVAIPRLYEEPQQEIKDAAVWRGVPLYSGGNLSHYAENVLGDALLWAQACAMIQPVTLGMSDKLRLKFQPDLPAERVGRLFALPNTTYNNVGLNFSAPILSVLRYGFSLHWSEDEQRRILQFILEKIKETEPPQPESLAHLSWEYVYERVRLEIEPDQALRQLTALEQTPLRDTIKAEFKRIGLPSAGHGGESPDYRRIPLRRWPVRRDSWHRFGGLTGASDTFNADLEVFKNSQIFLKDMRYLIR